MLFKTTRKFWLLRYALAERSATAVTKASRFFFLEETLYLESLALQPLALKFPRPAHGFCSLAGTAFGRLLKVATELHLAKDAFALHLLLQRLQRLVDVVVTDENLHLVAYSLCGCTRPCRAMNVSAQPADSPARRGLYHRCPEEPKGENRQPPPGSPGAGHGLYRNAWLS